MPAKSIKGVAALDRGLQIMDAFGDERGGLTLSDLAAKTGFYKSTILRLAASLERFGYVSRLKTGQFVLGPTPFRIGQRYQRSFRLADHVRPLLQELASSQRESASFWIADGDHRVCLFRVDSPQPVRDALIREGDRLPPDSSATSAVLRTFTGPEDRSLAKSRKSLVRASIGGYIRDLAGLSCPVFDHDGKLVGALTLTGPIARFDKGSVARMSAALLEAARLLTRQLGGSPDIYDQAKGTKGK
jgi:DNA-binding IclR family transcriptional regulator